MAGMGKLQLDMFAAEEAELFPTAPVVFRPDPDRVRRRLARILNEARAAETMPWDEAQLRLYEKVVPQMSLALSEEEAAQFRLEFEAELERLG
jgi:hypothetical protein